MPEGLPDQLWTNYETFVLNNRSGLYFGAALFALGFTTVIITGFVSLCRRTCCGKASTKKLSDNPRNSLDNPLYTYISSRECVTSREQLVAAEAGFEDDHQIVDTLESAELNEEPTVIYENEQFFHTAKRTKSTEVENVIHPEEGGKSRSKYAYSQVIKQSTANAEEKKGKGHASDIDKRTKDIK
ncbi:uncharacterized protein LOC110441158 [Mizuhopecten yessoensis]|uniref:Uncharacterized protein n=1 Tax=Mizuhopecten yessoensis TaxID=6573 RepID=A0A210PJU7_MIZYE|nr:uncharacterized protein LOC110441158 [Mizuhopecten yessoensis]OWF36768.1 hypothetical protein KP79_PYT02892 [Mizuhopecten yessoensis]